MRLFTDLELLRAAPPGHLRAIAETRRLSLPGGAAARAGGPDLEEIARRLFHAPSLREALRGLGPPQRAILREMARCGGQAPNYDLRAYLIAAGLIPGSGRAPEARASLYELAVGRLLGSGLVFWGRLDALSSREYASGAHEGLLVVPPSVLALLEESDLTDGEMSAALWQPRAPRSGSADVLQRDLYLYWHAVREQSAGLPLLANGQLAKAALRPLNAALSVKTELEGIRSEQEAGRLFFLRLLAQALGLLEAREETLRAVDAPTFFAQSVAERARRSFTAWLDGAFWNELLYLPDVTLRPQPPETAHPETRRARLVALSLLGEEAPEGWVSRMALLTLARLRQPHLLFPPRGRGQVDRYSAAGNPFGLDFRPRGGALSRSDSWLRVEGAFLAAVIEGPLFWLGAVDLDEAAAGEPLAYHLSPVGLALLGKGAWPQALTETESGRLVIQPNFEALALPPLSESLLYFLDQVAERQSLDQAALYRLTRERWLSALQRGESAARLIERLEDLAGTDLPQNMRYSLLEWERQAQRVRLYRGVALLETPEAALLDALLADATLAPLILRRLTPTAALIDRQRLPLLYQALLERGQLPRVIHPL
ncbi:MAG TPA: helicase-associated domain-containing protein [Ktedonobacterales bacterium]|jgi:hypothetical protein